MLRAYQYRLYPNKTQEKTLWKLLSLACWLYNSALKERKEAWRKRKSISYLEQALQLKEIRETTELKQLNFSACQQVLRRLDKAFKAFFKGSGYPRFKRPHRFRSLEFRYGDGISLRDGKLYIQNVGKVKVKWHRPLPNCAVKDIVITKKVSGWYATLRIELPATEFISNGKSPIGLDVGVVNLIALSNGQTINSPKWFQVAQERLAIKQRKASKKIIGSKRWRKMCCQIAKLHRHIANQRRDFWHKLTTQLVNNYGFIAFEDLNISAMAKGLFPKQILDSGWAMGIGMLSYKAWSAGAYVIPTPYNGTSQYCSECGIYVPKDLSVRIHFCPSCNLVLDRDVNAARNILKLGLEQALGEGIPSFPKEAVCFS